ncbi:hypothetical protein [Candidatus Nitrosocosmicus arcticus]|uniref:Uncharacterized protein n=1 Tax=Candidatus Nitrosocosmicus arcticus TaxID=2035267 RepID=A0A557SUT7_9ARCH|nr:hypothetical protein [Candidatus Nitrosocosmicus arcticus]TVP40372.1 hypothetical protein NARC_80100 [Candidatus Nitrosocosmicus arcticus]
MHPPISTKEKKMLMILNSDEIKELNKAPFTIKSIELVGNEIEIKVSYIGGCKTHEFILVADKFLDLQPTRIHLNLSHDDNGDKCKRIVTDNLVFDLSPLAKVIPPFKQKEAIKLVIGDKIIEFDPT